MSQRAELRVVEGGRPDSPPEDDRTVKPAPIPIIPPPSYTWLVLLVVGVIVSLVVHGGFIVIAIMAPRILQEREDVIVQMLVVEQPPAAEEPEPEPEEPAPEEPEPEPEPEVVDFQDAIVAEEPSEAQPEATAPPVFGVDMSSTVNAGSSWSINVGNTITIDPEDSADPSELEEDGVPVVSYEHIEREPVPIKRFEPPYPEGPKAAGIEGDVLLYLTIDENGDVTDVQVVSGPHAELNEAARQAMYQHRFKPGIKGGRPVVITRFPYYFTWIIEE